MGPVSVLSLSSVPSLPNDAPRLAALLLGLAAPWVAVRLLAANVSRRRLGLLAAAAAAGLSLAYVVTVLRGGPRIIDATSYWLEARALSRGWLAWPLTEPAQSVLGRFLVQSPEAVGWGTAAPGTTAASVIFPPGWPAVLALGFVLGAPMLVGPAIAAALVLATMALARAAAWAGAWDGRRPGHGASDLERLAAAFSVVCAALRYHTADTMSHGLAALCFTTALAAGIGAATLLAPGSSLPPPSPGAAASSLPRAREARALSRTRALGWGLAAVTGLAAGWLAATRPASVLALGVCLVLLGWHHWRAVRALRALQRRRARRSQLPDALRAERRASWLALGLFLLGCLPGLVLLAAHQRAATGSWWQSPQLTYYARSDGPAGCYGWGLGSTRGCLGEHGTFVGHNLAARGFGVLEALATTLRRLTMHLADALNFAPSFLLVPLGAWLARSSPIARLLGWGVLAQLLAYAPFYFDGNYPGGGGRMLVDVVPLEHVLAAGALVSLAKAAPAARPSLTQLGGATLLVALWAFTFQTGADHAQLRDREGARPMFERAVLDAAPAARAAREAGQPLLVLLDTDHGFNLAYDPGDRLLRVARFRDDDHDRLAWEAAGRPATVRYRFEPPSAEREGAAAARVRVEPLSFDARPTPAVSLRLRARSWWPARHQQHAWAFPASAPCECASDALALRVTPEGASAGSLGSVTLGLPGSALGGRAVRLRLGCLAAATRATLSLRADGREVARWELGPELGTDCVELEPQKLPAGTSETELEIETNTTLWLESLLASAQRHREPRPHDATGPFRGPRPQKRPPSRENH